MTRELPPLPLSPPNAPPQDGTSSQKTFVHVPSSIEAEEAEEIGVEHLLRDVKSLSSGGALSSRVSDQLSSLRGLGTRLLEIKEYLEQVVEGQLPVNHQIVYNLQDVFNLLPNLDAAAAAPREGEDGAGVKRPFTVATNDQLLVMYLSSLIRAVIALHDLVGVSLFLPSGVVCSDPAPLAAGSEQANSRTCRRRRRRRYRRRRSSSRRSSSGEGRRGKEGRREGRGKVGCAKGQGLVQGRRAGALVHTHGPLCKLPVPFPVASPEFSQGESDAPHVPTRAEGRLRPDSFVSLYSHAWLRMKRMND